MLVGYARVSTSDQRLDLQLDALRDAGCERTFTDEDSGAKTDCPGLTEALAFARTGDTLVFHVFGALAEFERVLIRERTMAGLAFARARGCKGGRPRAMDEEKIRVASRLMKDPEVSVAEV